MFKRIDLVSYRKTLVTPDMAEAIRQVELKAVALGTVRLVVQGPTADRFTWSGVRSEPGSTEYPPYASMRSTGREIQMRAQLIDPKGSPVERKQRELEILWGLVIPCGFTPWIRYPMVGKGDDTFHFLGPWQVLYDSFLGEGRGEAAWPSLCIAAQVDVGKWEGDHPTERFVQAQLHRLGVSCGVPDGVVGPRTLTALRALGLMVNGQDFNSAAHKLLTMNPPKETKTERRRGFISVDGQVNAVSSGKVALTKNPQGYALAIDGPGRVIVDVGESV